MSVLAALLVMLVQTSGDLRARIRAARDPAVRARLLERAAARPGFETEMLAALEQGPSERLRRIGARYFASGPTKVGLEVLRALLDESKERAVRTAVLEALGEAAGRPEAARLFARGIADATRPERFAVLRALAGVKTPAVEAFRRACLEERDASLRIEALAQLQETGADVRDRILREADRCRGGRGTGALLRLLARTPGTEVCPRIARLAALHAEHEGELPPAVAARLAARTEVRDWARRTGARSRRAAERALAAALLEAAGEPGDLPLLRALAGDRDRDVRIRAYGALARRRDPAAVPLLLAALARPTAAERLAAFDALAALQSPELDRRLPGMARAGPLELRLAALDLAAARGLSSMLELLPELLRARDPRVVIAAAALAGRVRRKASIPLLIAAMARCEGRPRAEIRRALQRLTRLYFEGPEAWARWWSEAGAAFELPPPPSAPPRVSGAGTRARFYGLPIESRRVVFCVDASRSMRARAGTGLSRFALARRELERALKAMPDGSRVAVFFFAEKVASPARGLLRLDAGSRARILSFAGKLEPSGGTDLWAVLERALAVAGADTLFLLSDGEATSGRIIDPQRITRAFLRRNRIARLRVHTVALGHASAFLRHLAEATGGRHAVR